MKTRIVYVKGHEGSERQANTALQSLLKYGWDAYLEPGVVPDTLPAYDRNFPNATNSRLNDFQLENEKVYLRKKSCVYNTLNFAYQVLDAGYPMASVEHDVIAVGPWRDYNVDDFCVLTYQFAKQLPSPLGKPEYTRFKITGKEGLNDFPSNWPLVNKRPTFWNGGLMPAGMMGYILTPKGARKIINTAEQNGIDQCEYMVTSKVVRMQYVWPSPINFDSLNYNLSGSKT